MISTRPSRVSHGSRFVVLSIAAALAVGLVSVAANAAVTLQNMEIIKIVDGDTVHVLDQSGKKIKIRMVGMDTPELHLATENGFQGQLPWGDDAAEYLAQLLPLGAKVEVISFGQDKYGRTLGQVIYRGLNVNVEQVQQGHAVSYVICNTGACTKQDLEEQLTATLQSACNEAQKARRGIFSASNPLKELPFEFRLRLQHRKPDKFVGDLRTQEYVTPERYKEIPACDRLFFLSESDAKTLGYSFRK